MINKIVEFVKSIKIRWWFVYIAYALFLYFHIFGISGAIGATVAIILLHNKIGELGKSYPRSL